MAVDTLNPRSWLYPTPRGLYWGATRAGTKTTVQISLDGEEPWSRIGELDFLDNRIDRGSGTMHARATLSNPDLTIVPGQFARIRVPVSPAQPELLVPDSALVTDQSTNPVVSKWSLVYVAIRT